MKKHARFEVKPLDIRQIRRGIKLNLREMGERLSCYSKGADNETFVASRISEWERGHRAVPAYVFHAAAYTLLDSWADDRHAVAREKIPEVDVYYGTLLNKPFGALIALEHDLSKSGNAESNQLETVRNLRRMQQRYIEVLLDVKMGYVFAVEPGGFDEVTAGEVL